MAEAKILLIDIETSPIRAYTWGPMWETNLIEVIEQSTILSYSSKWFGGKIITQGWPDYKGYKAGVKDDTAIVKDIWNLLDEADIVIAHNGKAFDVKTINARFLVHGLKPTSPYKIIDTKTEIKKYFRLPSNSLDNICDYFGLGRKLEHEGFGLWKKCEAGDQASWKRMMRYNKHDTVLLNSLYELIRPWMRNHPSVAALIEKPDQCPNCGSKKCQARGWSRTKTRKYRRFQCECGAWYQATKSEPMV